MKNYPPEVLDVYEWQQWIDRVMPHGQDIQEQYEYYNVQKDQHPVEWHGNVEMETNRYTKERN